MLYVADAASQTILHRNEMKKNISTTRRDILEKVLRFIQFPTL